MTMRMPTAALIDIDNTVYAYDPAHAAGLRSAHIAAAEIYDPWGAYDLFLQDYAAAKKTLTERLGDQAAVHSRLLAFKLMIERVWGRTTPEAVTNITDAYWGGYLDAMVLDHDFMETATCMKRLGMRLAWVSNFTTARQITKLRRLGIEDVAEFLFTSEEVGADKPNPALGRMALQTLDLPPELVWFIGDDLVNDVGLARALGMQVIRLARDAVRYLDDADLVVSSWGEIRDLVLKLHSRQS